MSNMESGQYWNALSPMYETLSGIDALRSDSHWVKAQKPMDSSPSRRTTELRALHP